MRGAELTQGVCLPSEHSMPPRQPESGPRSQLRSPSPPRAARPEGLPTSGDNVGARTRILAPSQLLTFNYICIKEALNV